MWQLMRQRAFWVGMLFGVAVGLFVGWIVWPVSYTDAYPSELRDEYKLEYLLLVARDYQQTQNIKALERRLKTFDQAELVPLLERALNTYKHPDEQQALRSVLNTVRRSGSASQGEPRPAEAPAETTSGQRGFSLTRVASIFLLLLGVLILVFVLVKAVGLMRASLPRRVTPQPVEEDWEPGEVEVVDVMEEEEEDAAPVSTAEPVPSPTFRPEPVQTAEETSPAPAPVAPSLRLVEVISPTFLLQAVGEEGYDESFSIEEDGERLGECGVGEIESLPGRDGQPIVMEIWLLDKADAKTHQAYILSPWAYRQADIRQKYEDQGSVFVAQHGNTLRLNARSLYLEGEIKDVAFTQAGDGDQVFSKLALEMKVYRRVGTRA